MTKSYSSGGGGGLYHSVSKHLLIQGCGLKVDHVKDLGHTKVRFNLLGGNNVGCEI